VEVTGLKPASRMKRDVRHLSTVTLHVGLLLFVICILH